MLINYIMFFVNKYRPKNGEETYSFHKDIIKKLKIISKDNSMPHIIFYGPEGSGKKTIINMFLKMIFDDEYINDTKECIYKVSSSGNTTKEQIIKQSNHHIVIVPKKNNFDRYIIQDVVKKYARRRPISAFIKKKPFKVVVINNVDDLSSSTQDSLRRTMEIFSDRCRFIMWSRSLSNVLKPLQSRCLLFRVPSPTKSELFNLICEIAALEKIDNKLEVCNTILNKSHGNTKTALWLLQLYKHKKDISKTNLTSYDNAIHYIINKMMLYKNTKNIIEIRTIIYDVLITNITGTTIIKDLVDKLILHPKIPNKCKIQIPEIAAECECNLVQGRREIMHLDLFVISVMALLDEHFS